MPCAHLGPWRTDICYACLLPSPLDLCNLTVFWEINGELRAILYAVELQTQDFLMLFLFVE